jgi:hypothetical protein
MSPPSVDNPKQWRRRVYRFWRLTLSAGGAQWPPRGQGSIRINSRTQQKPHLRKTQICCSHDTIFGVNKLQELKYIKLQVCITVHQTAALYYSTSNCRAALQYTKLQPYITVHQTAGLHHSTPNCSPILQYIKLQGCITVHQTAALNYSTPNYRPTLHTRISMATRYLFLGQTRFAARVQNLP